MLVDERHMPKSSTASAEAAPKLPSWTLDDIPFDQIDASLVSHREDLLYLAASASFIEIASDLYTSNLIGYFDGDDEVVAWLKDHWQHEELRHGYSLRAYVQHAWPDFDWEEAYRGFFDEYSKLCTVDEFEPTRGLEMAARCVVETGTATFYTALAQQTDEPVLSGIAARIRADEVSHYKHFFQYFRWYESKQTAGRWKVLKAIGRRIVEARNSDAEIGLWHVYRVHTGNEFGRKGPQFKQLCSRLGSAVKRHYPVNMATKMVLRPMGLSPRVNKWVQPPLCRAAGWLLR